MSASYWWDELQALVARFSAMGIGPDLVALTLADAWALYLFLRGLAQGGGNGG
jgi:hypothetical protein